MIGSTVKLNFDASAVKAGFAKVSTGFKTLGRGMASVGRTMLAPFAKLMALLAPLVGVGAGIYLFKNASKEAAELELMGTAFETLLGSVEKAGARIKELERFSVLTPFEPDQVIKSSKLLQTLGGDVLATGKGLRMVGDAASVAGQPLEEVALHIGRIFGAITSGTSAGVSVARMQELGLMTGTLKIRFEELAAAQKKGTAAVLSDAQALRVLQGVFAKTEGAMERLSQTFSGRVSTLKGNWSALMVEMGKGLNSGLGAWVDKLNESLPKFAARFAQVGKAVGDGLKLALAAFEQGNLGELLWTSLKYAGAKFAEFFSSVIEFGINKALVALGKSEMGKKLGLGGGANEHRFMTLPNGNKVIQANYKTYADTPENRAAILGQGMSFGDILRNNQGAFGSSNLKRSLDGISAQANRDNSKEWMEKMNWTQEQMKISLQAIDRNTRDFTPAFAR